jgi:hypothetical protein
MERIRFATREGKRVLVVDLKKCSSAEVERVIRSLPDQVTTQPLQSVLLLADFSGASFSEDALRTMKETAIFDKPYIKKSAWVGAESLPTRFREEISKFSGREFPIFKDFDEAIAWLTKD